MGYIDARDLLMEVSQDYSWPEMYLVDVHEFPILFGMSCFVFSAEMKWLLTPSLSRAINDGQSVQAWYLRVDIHSKCWRGAPFTWIGFPFVSHGNHQRDTVSLRVLFWQLPPQEARRRQNEEPLFFFWGVPCVKLAAFWSRSLTEGPPGSLLPLVANMDGEIIWDAAEHRPESQVDIYIYMSIYLINTFMCYFRRFYVFIFCCVSKILTTLNSQGMPPLTYALSNILEQQGFLMRKSVSWCLWSIANWYVQIRNYTPGN